MEGRGTDAGPFELLVRASGVAGLSVAARLCQAGPRPGVSAATKGGRSRSTSRRAEACVSLAAAEAPVDEVGAHATGSDVASREVGSLVDAARALPGAEREGEEGRGARPPADVPETLEGWRRRQPVSEVRPRAGASATPGDPDVAGEG